MSLERYQNLTVNDILLLKDYGHTNQLSYYKKNDPELIRDTLSMMLVKFAKSFNFRNNVSPDQIREIADEIMREFFYFTPEDILIVLREIKVGRHGKHFESMDIHKIMTALTDYDQRRSTIVESQGSEERIYARGRSAPRLSPAMGSASVASVRDVLDAREKSGIQTFKKED